MLEGFTGMGVSDVTYLCTSGAGCTCACFGMISCVVLGAMDGVPKYIPGQNTVGHAACNLILLSVRTPTGERARCCRNPRVRLAMRW